MKSFVKSENVCKNGMETILLIHLYKTCKLSEYRLPMIFEVQLQTFNLDTIFGQNIYSYTAPYCAMQPCTCIWIWRKKEKEYMKIAYEKLETERKFCIKVTTISIEKCVFQSGKWSFNFFFCCCLFLGWSACHYTHIFIYFTFFI